MVALEAKLHDKEIKGGEAKVTEDLKSPVEVEAAEKARIEALARVRLRRGRG